MTETINWSDYFKFKELCNDHELKIIDIYRAYNISPSLIYKIKRSIYDQLNEIKMQYLY